jgi:hypothetical protein
MFFRQFVKPMEVIRGGTIFGLVFPQTFNTIQIGQFRGKTKHMFKGDQFVMPSMLITES